LQTINKLFLGDNLEILKQLDSESVDLIYLDPPFFSNKTYEVIWGDKGEVRSFEDRFSGGIDHYISWLKERVAEMHRILKSTGSIFLHCDWHANSYIRTEILDKIFGYQNFINEIVWCYTAPANVKNRFPQKHDTIYFYSKTKNYFFSSDNVKIPYNQETVARTGRGAGATGLKVKGDAEERHKNRLDQDGKVPEDYWIDIFRIQGNGNERIGYPTQKPIALLKRIIECATNENDIVLDPFVGGGTTVAAADKFNRRWIGIDQSVQAIKVTEFRLYSQQDLYCNSYTNSMVTLLHKYDYDTLRYKDAFAFETFIVQQFGGVTNTKQRGDLGLDGKTKEGSPIQVKRSDNIGRNVVDNFLSAVQRFDKKLFDKNIAEQKPIGYIIAFSFGRGAVEEVARLKNKENQIIALIKVEDIIPIAKKPTIKVEVVEVSKDKKDTRELEFIATAESVAGIEFYAWDFGYQADKGFKPQIMIDKTGKQSFKFKAGLHNIAVKVVDNDGLDNIEVIKLKVNGTVERT
jgi:DNA modification methylase